MSEFGNEDLLNQLKSVPTFGQAMKTAREDPQVTEENLEKYIMDASVGLTERCLETIDELKDIVEGSLDPELVAAYAGLVKNGSSALTQLNKIALQNKKDKTTLQKTQMEIDSREKIADGQTDAELVNTDFIVSNRQQILDALTGSVDQKQIKQESL